VKSNEKNMVRESMIYIFYSHEKADCHYWSRLWMI
jgi:hypothetical protein